MDINLKILKLIAEIETTTEENFNNTELSMDERAVWGNIWQAVQLYFRVPRKQYNASSRIVALYEFNLHVQRRIFASERGIERTVANKLGLSIVDMDNEDDY